MMKRIDNNIYNHKASLQSFLLISIIFFLTCGCEHLPDRSPVKVLIISGKNNHEWQKTTPLLLKIYNDSRLFITDVSLAPDTLTFSDLNRYNVIVSNWNSWPDNELRISEQWEKDLLKYIKKGGAMVSIHAGASSFYTWDEYHKIGIGRWGKETNHGEPLIARVVKADQSHPVTKGFKDFYIVDEIWEKTEIHPDSKALAFVSATGKKDGHPIIEPAVFVSQTGKGRCFFTVLGHDERALLNTGLQTLILRATQWAAHQQVTIAIPADLREGTISKDKNLGWESSDTTISLVNNDEIIWQYNYNNRFGKAYFHPLTIRNSSLTCVSPPDHSWHQGLWFSWKFINEVNYWEYLSDYKTEETGYRAAGITGVSEIKIFKNPDFSADIKMILNYHPAGGEPILHESRTIHVSPPGIDGSYFIDHNNIFTPLTENVVLDRTPITGEPDGQSWGGYSGLSVRFNQDYTSPLIIAPDTSMNYKKNNWVYMGFSTLTGDTAGICILQNPAFTTAQTSWYVINDPGIPFYYYSPAAIFDGKIMLKKGEQLQLKYRIWIIPGKTGKEELDLKYSDYLNEI